MFARLGRFITTHPSTTIAVWVASTVAIVALSPTLDSVTNADQTSFLPDDYGSVQAAEFASEAFPEQAGGSSAVFVVTPEDDGARLSEAQAGQVAAFVARLQSADIPTLRAVVTGPEHVAPGGTSQLVRVSFAGAASDERVQEAIAELRQRASELPGGLEAGLTGDAALLVDNEKAHGDAELIVMISTVALILALMLAIFRSPVAALLPLLSVGLVFAAASSLVALLADALSFQISADVSTLLVVVMFGIGTDYILFLLFRYRERLRRGEDSREAVRQAVARVGRVISTAALVVILALAALLLSEFESFQNMAPGLAISVAVMLLAALTLIPALLALIGPRLFWPSRAWRNEPGGKVSKRVGRTIAARPGPTAIASGGVLVAFAIGALFYQANYDPVDSLPSGTESAQAFEELTRAFPAGALNPTSIYVRGGGQIETAELRGLASQLDDLDEVAQVGRPQVNEAETAAQIPVVLAHNPFSDEALDAVAGGLRDVAGGSQAGAEVLVGGQTATFADVRSAVSRDLAVVFSVAAALIAVILAVLLRALAAPLYLLAAVALGSAAALGATVAVFQGLGGEAGLMFSLPIILYVFVVAIGTDYNILMVSRLREEADAGNDPHTAADLAVEHAGPTVAAAGAILAGTFASLILTGVPQLTQLGLAVCVGIVLAAFAMASVFVPSVTALLGRRAWWPSHRDGARSTGAGAKRASEVAEARTGA